MLDLEILPENSLGCDAWEFVLGMHFSQAIAIIQSQVGIIKGVQVLYSDTNPLGVDIIINLPQDGVRLIFDPVIQRLKTIEVFNMKLVKLRYGGVYFNSPEVLPSIEQIEHSFGATEDLWWVSEQAIIVLLYIADYYRKSSAWYCPSSTFESYRECLNPRPLDRRFPDAGWRLEEMVWRSWPRR